MFLFRTQRVPPEATQPKSPSDFAAELIRKLEKVFFFTEEAKLGIFNMFGLYDCLSIGIKYDLNFL